MKYWEDAVRLPRLYLSRREEEMPMHFDAILIFLIFHHSTFSILPLHPTLEFRPEPARLMPAVLSFCDMFLDSLPLSTVIPPNLP